MLRGKATDKVAQHHHERLSTFGIGADLSEAQWRAVLRQLIALGHLRTEGEYNTLEPTASAREVLRGEVHAAAARGRRRRPGAAGPPARRAAPRGKGRPPPLPLDDAGLARFAALKAWRTEVAREHNLPPYVVFHDATLAEMARSGPTSLAELSGDQRRRREEARGLRTRDPARAGAGHRLRRPFDLAALSRAAKRRSARHAP